MDSTLSVITEIRPKFARYAKKNMWAWYAMHAPRSETKRCCIPEVRYFSLGSEENALSRLIAKVFLNLVEH